MLTLSEKQVKQLETVISQMPTMWGIQIINILNAKEEENTDAESGSSEGVREV
jgi:hypothetical protein